MVKPKGKGSPATRAASGMKSFVRVDERATGNRQRQEEHRETREAKTDLREKNKAPLRLHSDRGGRRATEEEEDRTRRRTSKRG